METRRTIVPPDGFTLIELVFTVSILGICVLLGVLALYNGVSVRQARGAAQAYQATAAWAQVGALWHGGAARAVYSPQSLAVSHEYDLGGGLVDGLAPGTRISTNVARWRHGEGAVVSFSGSLASPDGGGSLLFHTSRGAFSVTVRPESGLTVRGCLEPAR